MNVLILGSGGREHALAWKIAQSPLLERLYLAPGNAGTVSLATNLPLSLADFDAIARAITQYAVDLVVVGPELPLVNGFVDFCRRSPDLHGLRVVGPDAAGAALEGSKAFAKAFMIRHGIPTAAYKSFTAADYEAAKQFLETLDPPYVLKADGLAAGKGVLIEQDLETAKEHLAAVFDGKFGAAGQTVVIEQFLKGMEVSVFVLTDGVHYKVLPEAKDYKRIGDGDTGLNTGGMGAVSPVCFATPDFMRKVESRIIVPTLRGLREEGITYDGFLFLGLMNCEGDPYVIEYNVRMGDPETEAVMLRLQGDLLEALHSLQSQTLDSCYLGASEKTAVCVVSVAGGYPESYEKGAVIDGLDAETRGHVFHMGTSLRPEGVVTAGGRVLAVCALADDLSGARAAAYAALDPICFDGCYSRRDIGQDLLACMNL